MSSILGLDVGNARVGVAIADSIARLPRPLTTLDNNESFSTSLQHVIDQETVTQLVVGVPRDMQGNETAQTRQTETFIAQLKNQVATPIATQDEALTSQQAEEELEASGKPFSKGDVDALAACYILQDYLQEHPS